jgi:hypothetical protein
MGLMRFTVVDVRSTVSFIGPDRALHAFVAACASGANSIEELLESIAPFVGEVRELDSRRLRLLQERRGASLSGVR